MHIFPQDMTTEILLDGLKKSRDRFAPSAYKRMLPHIETLIKDEPFKKFFKILYPKGNTYEGMIAFLCTDVGLKGFHDDEYLKNHTFVEITREEYNENYLRK